MNEPIRNLLAGLVVSMAVFSAACGGGTGAPAPAKPAAQAPAAAPSGADQSGAAAAPTSGGAQASAPASTASCDRNRTYRFANLPLGWVGAEIIQYEGLLEKRGWKVDWQSVSQISAMVNTFASGQADVIPMSVVILGQMYENNVKLKVFGVGMGVLGAVVVPTGSPARELPDLRGKKVGVITGGTTSQDMNASSRLIYNFDLFRDTEAITANAPPELANLARSGNVDAVLVWEPTTSLLTRTGDFRILAHQQDLWERAQNTKETEIHVAYLTTPQLAEQCPELLGDINAAHKEAHDIWYGQKDKAVRILADYNKLTPEEAEYAMSQTRQVLYGLTDANIDTMLAQLKYNREYGTLLKSDIWNDPAQVRRDMFFIPPTRN